MSSKSHKKNMPHNLTIGIITVSTTRTLENDKSGHWMGKLASKEGHQVVYHQVIPDDMEAISNTVVEVIRKISPNVVLLTGGTGISSQDVTIEAASPLFEKHLTAFGPLFSQLSYEEIDSAALLSRASAGIIGKTLVFCMPGSLNACKLACKALIFPELGHLVKHIRE